MKYLCLFFMILVSSNLSAAALRKIAKDSGEVNNVGFSLAQQVKAEDREKIIVTVKINQLVEGDEIIGVYLYGEEKGRALQSVVKDGVATISFEVEKSKVEKLTLNVSYAKNTGNSKIDEKSFNCGISFMIELKEFIVVDKEEKK